MKNGNYTIRPATPADAGAILDIYTPYVLHTAITFEYTVPTTAEFSDRIANILSSYPFFVCETANKIVGYAYATKFRERAAYQWDIETSVYVLEMYQREGVATLLYKKLLDECVSYGFHNAYAVITLPNTRSVSFHRKHGFTDIGIFKNTGFKNGEWHSVLFMEKNLIPAIGIPETITKPKK